MASWSLQYLAALKVRDDIEKANLKSYNAYRTAGLDVSLNPQASGDGGGDDGDGKKGVLARVRKDLVEAQRSRTELEAQLKTMTEEFDKLKAKARVDARHIQDTQANTTTLTRRLRDREDELRAKAKLLEDLQDETVTLNLQLNMAEEQAKKLQSENKDLIDRWMARVSKEADAMNVEAGL